MLRIVLVAIHPYKSPQALPLANAFLKSSLASDVNLGEKTVVELCDFFVGESVDNLVSGIISEDPDAVGISIYLWNREIAGRVAAALRRGRPHLSIFGGGPEPTADPEGLLRGSHFDFLIMGEGELTLVEAISALVAGKGAAGIEGTASMESGAVVVSRRRHPAPLDSIPSPYLTGVIDPARYGGVLWQLSRGCGFACDYCFDSQGMGGVRRFSMERVRAELALFVEKGVSQVFVIDSTFNQEKKRAKEVLRLIATVAPHIHFHFEVRSEFIDGEMARLFARINCSLQIGLQSAHPTVHRMVNREFDPANFSGKIRLLNESGAIFGFDLIYGLPGDTLDGFSASIDFALAHYPNHLDIFPLAVLPGTALAAKADGLGLRYLKVPPYTIESSPGFPPRSMKEAAGIAMACDIFYSRGKAVAWFNQLLAPLGLPPSAFLRKFLKWLKKDRGIDVSEAVLSDEDIRQIQCRFIACLYGQARLEKLLPAALDQINYNWHYAAALLAVPPDLPSAAELGSKNLLDLPVVLSPSACVTQFNHDILDIVHGGGIDLESFAQIFKPTGSYAVIFPMGGEVLTEPLTESQFNLLSRLDGRSPREIAATLHFPPRDAGSFLKLCALRGIISP